MTTTLYVIIALTATLVFNLGSVGVPYVSAEKCEDVKGTMKWGSTDHKDNNPSESKFEKMIFGKATICEVAKCYDHDECKGTIKSDDWKDFKESFVYVGTTDDVQDCLDYRFKLPDDCDKALQAYEIKDCALGDY